MKNMIWGVCVLLLSVSPAFTDQSSDPWLHLPITGDEYTRPEWIKCQEIHPQQVKVAGWVVRCDRVHEFEAGLAEVVVHDPSLLDFAAWVNARVNDAVSDTSPEGLMKASIAKRQIIELSGRPAGSLLYAIAKWPKPVDGKIEYVVPYPTLVMQLDSGDYVFGIDGVWPWHCFPGKFEGVQSPWWTGQWVTVDDWREDPLDASLECVCSDESRCLSN